MLDVRLASLAVLVACAMCLSGGCSGGAGSGEMVELASGETQGPDNSPPVAEDLPDAEPKDAEPEEPADPGPQPPIGRLKSRRSRQV